MSVTKNNCALRGKRFITALEVAAADAGNILLFKFNWKQTLCYTGTGWTLGGH